MGQMIEKCLSENKRKTDKSFCLRTKSFINHVVMRASIEQHPSLRRAAEYLQKQWTFVNFYQSSCFILYGDLCANAVCLSADNSEQSFFLLFPRVRESATDLRHACHTCHAQQF